MSQYIHWAKAAVTLDFHYRYDSERSKRFQKPFGLWFEVDGDWQRWCQSEMPEWLEQRFKIPHEVQFAPEHVLFLRNALEIDAFTSHFGDDRSIDWIAVAEEYSGIVIAPYCWERRLSQHTFWYYPWDCASGCIWDLATIQVFRPIELCMEMSEQKGDR